MGNTLTEFEALLRTDLKDSGTLWSNAELDRCVQLAVADLSRFMPLEKAYELTLNHTVSGESFTTLVASSAIYFVNAKDISASVSGDTCTLAARTPDQPRTVLVTVTDANTSITNFTIIVKGLDDSDRYVEESFYRKDGLVQTGKVLFKTVTEVEIDQVTGNGAADVLSVGTGSPTGVWLLLDNKPIRPASETVTTSPAATTYALGTDYEMDYINGRIRLITGTTMSANTAYLIGYTKSKLGVDISAIIPELIRIQRVEYPSDQVPQKFASYSIWGNFMYVGSQQTNKSQEELSNGKHLTVYYEREQSPPSIYSPGSYPEFMDEVVAIGGRAYALMMKGVQYEHQAVTDMASLKTILTSVTSTAAVHVLAKAALVLAGTQLGSAVVAGLFTKVDVALDATATVIGTMTTYLTGATAPSVKKYLDDGDAYIDTLNIGSQVAQVFATYAQTCSQLSSIIASQADAYVAEANVRLTESDRWYQAGMGYVAQANSYLQEIAMYLEESSRYADIVNGDLVMSDRFRTEGMSRMDEFLTVLKSKSEWRRKVAVVPVSQPA